jgi:hypothetical protein
MFHAECGNSYLYFVSASDETIEALTVVSNHFHSVNILLFSSTRSRDFDGLIGIELSVSMYTTKTPIDLCRFNVRSSTLNNLNIFCKRQISIKLFYLYQRLQCRDKYFFKIKLVFFLYFMNVWVLIKSHRTLFSSVFTSNSFQQRIHTNSLKHSLLPLNILPFQQCTILDRHARVHGSNKVMLTNTHY